MSREVSRDRAHFDIVAPSLALVRALGLEPEEIRFPWSCPRETPVEYRGGTRPAMDVPPGDVAIVSFTYKTGDKLVPCGTCKPCKAWRDDASRFLRDTGGFYPVPCRCARPVSSGELTETKRYQVRRLKSDNQNELLRRAGPQGWLLSNHPDAYRTPRTEDEKARDETRFQRVKAALVPAPNPWGVNAILRGTALALQWGAEVYPALARTLANTVKVLEPNEALNFLVQWRGRSAAPLTVGAFETEADQTASDPDPEQYTALIRAEEIRQREMAALESAANVATERTLAWEADRRETARHYRAVDGARRALMRISARQTQRAALPAPGPRWWGAGTPEPTRYNPPGAPFPIAAVTSRDGAVAVTVTRETPERVEVAVLMGPGAGRTLWMARAAFAARFGA